MRKILLVLAIMGILLSMEGIYTLYQLERYIETRREALEEKPFIDEVHVEKYQDGPWMCHFTSNGNALTCDPFWLGVPPPEVMKMLQGNGDPDQPNPN